MLKFLMVLSAVLVLIPSMALATYDIGDVVNDFTLLDVDGNSVSLYDFEGDVILLNFFATWCPPCNEESPILEQHFWQEYQDQGFTVLAVNLLEDSAIVSAWLEDLGLTFPVILAPDYSIWTQFPSAGGIPYNAIIDQSMVLRLSHYNFDETEAREMVEALLENQPVSVGHRTLEDIKLLFR